MEGEYILIALYSDVEIVPIFFFFWLVEAAYIILEFERFIIFTLLIVEYHVYIIKAIHACFEWSPNLCST